MNAPLYPAEDYVVQECQCDDAAELRFVLDGTGALVIIDDGDIMQIAPADVRRLARLLAAQEVPQ